MLEWALDVAIGVGMIWLAWKALAGEDLYRSVILFIAFGLVLALAWARLDAPDIALAEAAIGAGLTGALLLDAVAQLRRGGGESPGGGRALSTDLSADRPEPAAANATPDLPSRSATTSVLSAFGVALLGVAVAVALVSVADDPGGLTTYARESLHRSGVDHGVTAVLLNFRAFDTLLEIGVLLAAVLAMLVVRGTADLSDAVPPRPVDPVMTAAAVVIIPMMVLAAGYLLWLGTHAPGGAFQAGAVLASAAVLLFLAGRRSVGALGTLPFNLVLSVGFAIFLVVGLVTIVAGGLNLLELPPERAGSVIVIVEVMLTISIAATMAALFIGGRATEPATTPSTRGRP